MNVANALLQMIQMTSDNDSTSPSNASVVDGEDENVEKDSILYYECARCENNKFQCPFLLSNEYQRVYSFAE